MSEEIVIEPSEINNMNTNELQSYAEQGFAKIPGKIFTQSDYLELKDYVNDIFLRAGNGPASTAISSVHIVHPKILFWALSENILNIAESILGPNLGFWTCSIFYKKAQSAEKAYWHKDIAGIYRYNLFEDKNLINLTISMSRTDISNGCLKYLPGTHTYFIEHDWVAPKNDLITNSMSISEDRLDTSKAVYMELEENEASVHNVNVVHGSEPNLSDRDRMTMSCRFFSASSKCNLDNFSSNLVRPMPFLVRGEDIANSGLKKISLRDLLGKD